MNAPDPDGRHDSVYQRPGAARIPGLHLRERDLKQVAETAQESATAPRVDGVEDEEDSAPPSDALQGIRMHGVAAPPSNRPAEVRNRRRMPNPFLAALWVVSAVFVLAAVWATRELESGYAILFFGLEGFGTSADVVATQQRMARLQYLPAMNTAFVVGAAISSAAALSVHALKWRRDEPASHPA